MAQRHKHCDAYSLVRLAKQSMMVCAGRVSPLPDAAPAESAAGEAAGGAASDAASEAATANGQAVSLDGVSMAATTASSEAGRAPSQADGSVGGAEDAAASHVTEAADEEASVVALGTTASESSSLDSQAERAWRAALLGIDEPDFDSDSDDSLASSTPSSFDPESDSCRSRSESSKAGAISMYDAESQLGGSFMAAAAPEAAALLLEDGTHAAVAPSAASNAAVQQTVTGKCSG